MNNPAKRNRGTLLLSAAMELAIAAPLSFGQASAVAPGTHDLTAQLPAFDVATIKPSDPNEVGGRLRFIRDQFVTTGQTAKALIKFAYNLSFGSDQVIAGGPSWMESAKFDITAKQDEETVAALQKLTAQQQMDLVRPMVQALLADRFKLKVHHETKELPIYAVVVAKGGPRLRPMGDESATSSMPAEAQGGGALLMQGRGQVEGRGATSEMLSGFLSMQPEIGGRMVVDKTGLTDKYNFTLKWTPDDAPQSDTSDPSLLTALQEQLGLKLESQKGPVDVIVVDHIERPSEN